MADVAAQYRNRSRILRGETDEPEAPAVEEFVEVESTGQATIVEADETEGED